MINTNLIYNLEQTVLDSTNSKVPKPKIKTKDPEEDQIVESYEGDCEQCQEERLTKPCPICKD